MDRPIALIHNFECVATLYEKQKEVHNRKSETSSFFFPDQEGFFDFLTRTILSMFVTFVP